MQEAKITIIAIIIIITIITIKSLSLRSDDDLRVGPQVRPRPRKPKWRRSYGGSPGIKVEALTTRIGFLGGPYYNYSITYPKPYSNCQGPLQYLLAFYDIHRHVQGRAMQPLQEEFF